MNKLMMTRGAGRTSQRSKMENCLFVAKPSILDVYRDSGYASDDRIPAVSDVDCTRRLPIH